MRSYTTYQIITDHDTTLTLHPASVEELDAADEDVDCDFVTLAVAENLDDGRMQLSAHLDATDVEELIMALVELHSRMEPKGEKALVINRVPRISEEELAKRNAQAVLQFNYDERLPRSVE